MSLASFSITAQEFAPIGAEWFYTEYHAFSGDIGYFKIVCEKDTLFEGQMCKKLVKNTTLECANRPKIEYIYENDSVAYFYDPDFNEFQILYNFACQTDSSWQIKIKDIYSEEQQVDTLFVFVDSVSQIIINSTNLKELFVTYKGITNGQVAMTYSCILVQKIGSFDYLFNIYPYWSICCDANYSGGLRCYYDNEFGLYETGIADSCTYTYHYPEKEESDITSPHIIIFPNPANNRITIRNADSRLLKYILFDITGKILLSSYFSYKADLDIKNYPNGIYIILIQDKEKYIEKRKIVKY